LSDEFIIDFTQLTNEFILNLSILLINPSVLTNEYLGVSYRGVFLTVLPTSKGITIQNGDWFVSQTKKCMYSEGMCTNKQPTSSVRVMS
jgi:hypothetical protein